MISHPRIENDPVSRGYSRIVSFTSLREINPEFPELLLPSVHKHSKFYYCDRPLLSPLRRVYELAGELPTNSLPPLVCNVYSSKPSSDRADAVFMLDESEKISLDIRRGTSFTALEELRLLKQKGISSPALELIVSQLLSQNENPI